MSHPSSHRYPPGTDLLNFPAGVTSVQPTALTVTAHDRSTSKGLLWSRGGESTAVLIGHPTHDMTRHYLIPGLLDGGYAVYAHESRSPNNDSAQTHESFLLDVAASMRMLRDRGFQRIALLGYSGGGPAYCYYQAQAITAPPARHDDTPAGDPLDLNDLDMPPADAIMLVGAHKGTAAMLRDEIDGSVVDEHDPLSCDPTLDIYNPANGFREPPQPSLYDADFLARYRDAQRARCARIDTIALGLIEATKAADQALSAVLAAGYPSGQLLRLQRQAISTPSLHIHRTQADPATVDLSIDPSRRTYGAILSTRPDLTNYSRNSARFVTPQAWLSQWSPTLSRSTLARNLPRINQPTLIVNFTGDNSVHPHIARDAFDSAAATDNAALDIDCDHFGFPMAANPGRGRRDESIADALVTWLRARFP